jgi:hypothetical protein
MLFLTAENSQDQRLVLLLCCDPRREKARISAGGWRVPSCSSAAFNSDISDRGSLLYTSGARRHVLVNGPVELRYRVEC